MSSPDLDVLAVGELLVDLISTEQAPSLAETEEFRRYQGGSPANIAVNVAKLGMRSALIAKTGIGAFGQHCKRELSRFGVLTDYLVMDHHVRTTMVFVARTAGTPDFEVARQGDAELRPEEIPDEAVTRTRLVHASTFALSREPCRSAVRHTLQLARAQGKLVSLDPNYHPEVWPNLFEARAVLRELYPLVDLTKPSLDDAERLFGPGRTPEEYVEMFAELGAKTVVLTMGAKGMLLRYDGKIQAFPPHTVEVVDATGAGDAFWAGFLVAWLDEQPPERCMLFAREVADRKLRAVGPLPTTIDRDKVYAAL
jgi:fructokinase